MTVRRRLLSLLMKEDLNFLLTNRIPRRVATKAVGRVARICHPLVARPALATWRFFCDVDLSDSETTRFASLKDGFTRALRPGARPFDPDPAVVASPCDALIGAHGDIEEDRAYQTKGFPYRLDELIPDPELVARVRGGKFVTLRLTASMYHRMHAPHDIHVEGVTYLSGDCWNVNPIALKRVRNLFCRNERAVIEARLPGGEPLLIVPVAAILVAGIRLTFLDTERLLRERGPGRTAVDADLAKGEELGWFEHGSTVILFAPPGFDFATGVVDGAGLRAGEPLLRRA
jgi:phosphatidylserine decarboxylase